MCKLPPIVALGLCALLTGCQTPLFSDGLFGSLNSKKTFVADNSASESQKTASSSKPQLGGRGWRNAATRAAEAEAKAPATGLNNVNRLREFLAKGSDAMQRGLYDDARIQYETVLSIEPRHATAHHMLGRISDMDRKFDEAERHYLEALSANREDGYLLSDLGYSYLQQGRLDEARQYLTKAITLEPELAIAKVNLAAVYAYGGDERGALAWLRQVGTEQQAQETLASIVSKPAPFVYNGAAGALASGPDQYTITPEGQVLGKDGQPLTSWEDIQASMAELRKQGSKKRQYEEQLEAWQENERIKQAMAQETGSARGAIGAGNDANLNQQMRDIAQTSASQRQGQGNTRPIYVGPTAGNNGPGQHAPANNHANAPQAAWNNQQWNGQHQPPQNTATAQQDPYSNLLNPAGPTGFQGQTGFPGQAGLQGQANNQTPPGYLNQQAPRNPLGNQNYAGSPQFPGASSTDPRNPGSGTPAYQQQSPNPNSWPDQQRLHTQQLTDHTGRPHNNTAVSQYANQSPNYEQQTRFNPGSPGQHGNAARGSFQDQQGSSPTGQSGNFQPVPRSTAPNPAYFGQGNPTGSVTPQTGLSLNSQQSGPSQPAAGGAGQPGRFPNAPANYPQGQTAPINSGQSTTGWSNGQQPIQQLGYNNQPPLARIDRGRPAPQYSQADRQAMQLGMAAGFGGLAPIDSSQNQSQRQAAPQNQGTTNGATYQQGYRGFPGGSPPGNAYQQPSGQTSPYGSNQYQYGQQPAGQSSQSQQFSNQGYPGAAPAPNGQIPGQANVWAPGTSAHGQPATGQPATGQPAEQTVADHSRPNPQYNPQTAEHWRQMTTSPAGTTMPVAFSNSTQPLEQQSRNWSQPEQRSPSWQNESLSSPTTQPGFGQPHMTDPYLRQPATQSGQQPNGPNGQNGQTVQTATWERRPSAR